MKLIRLHNGKSEDVTKILNISTNGSLLFIGQKGTVVCRSPTLEQESKKVWDLCSAAQIACHCRKRRMSTFAITDATYLDISRHYCIATSNRSLHFLHVTSSDQWETFRLVDMPTIPICLENNFKESNIRQTCELFIGDHIGDIYILTFSFPRTMLFARSYTTDTHVIHFKNLVRHREYVTCRKLRNVHGDFVDNILWISGQNLLLSNSKRDMKRTLVLQDLLKNPNVQLIRHRKSVTCFDADNAPGLIVTGSKDFLVRLWKILDPLKAVFTLFGHCAVVADVRLWTTRELLLSICKELELKLWNINCGRLLCSILTNFTNIHREPHVGRYVLHIPTGNTSYFLVTCFDSSLQLDVIKMLKGEYGSFTAFRGRALS